MNALILYSTTDGHTQKIAEFIASHWDGSVRVLAFDAVESTADLDVDRVIIGASIRYGHFNPALVTWIKEHADWLKQRDSAFYSVNLTARKPGKNDPATSSYIKKFIHSSGWVPDHIAMFAGRLSYPKYRPFDKFMIRLIMKITGGCADGKSDIEYTDWDEVKRFAKTLSGLDA